jgi:hypothetical protein
VIEVPAYPAPTPAKYLKGNDSSPDEVKGAVPHQTASRPAGHKTRSNLSKSGSAGSARVPETATSPDEPPTVSASLMNQYNREQLHQQVWSASLKEAAEQHGVSESTLKSVCSRLYIPVLGRGYWKKKHVGKITGEWPTLPEVRITPAAQPTSWTSAETEPIVVSGRLMERYNREQLYEDVWRTPKSQLASKWGISEHTLGEVCRKLCIPVPDFGYWLRPAERRTSLPLPLPPVQADPRYLIRKRLSGTDQSADLGANVDSANSHVELSPAEFTAPESVVDSLSPNDCQASFGEASSLVHVPAGDVNDARVDLVANDDFDEQSSAAVALPVGTAAEVDHNSAKGSNTPAEDVAPFNSDNDAAERVREEDEGAEAGEAPPLSEFPTGDAIENDADGNGLPELEDSERVLLVQASLASRYDRKELYDRVWSVPMWTLRKEYGVSDVALAKTCKRLHIPVPGRGYWAMLAAGKPTQPRPPLPSVEVVERLASKRKNHHHSPDEAVALIKRIRAAVEVGKSVREACSAANISEDTYRRWLMSVGVV